MLFFRGQLCEIDNTLVSNGITEGFSDL